ncbi:hypothetical protein IQ06DRAFT_123633 [Phaeosphaeriaceae sp. SRC1lsM3a]|nr:hypothetical protein IQ06DRAFT_123633 [Stagonospora sp. SRC1lsM3a]
MHGCNFGLRACHVHPAVRVFTGYGTAHRRATQRQSEELLHDNQRSIMITLLYWILSNIHMTSLRVPRPKCRPGIRSGIKSQRITTRLQTYRRHDSTSLAHFARHFSGSSSSTKQVPSRSQVPRADSQHIAFCSWPRCRDLRNDSNLLSYQQIGDKYGPRAEVSASASLHVAVATASFLEHVR